MLIVFRLTLIRREILFLPPLVQLFVEGGFFFLWELVHVLRYLLTDAIYIPRTIPLKTFPVRFFQETMKGRSII